MNGNKIFKGDGVSKGSILSATLFPFDLPNDNIRNILINTLPVIKHLIRGNN